MYPRDHIKPQQSSFTVRLQMIIQRKSLLEKYV